MKPTVVKVPAHLILDRRLTASPKLLWMILQLADGAQASPGLLQSRSGLTRPTVLRGLARLESAGWLSATPAGGHTPTPVGGHTVTPVGGHTITPVGAHTATPVGGHSPAPVGGHTHPQGEASLPTDLLLNGRVGLQAKLLYGALQLTPGFRCTSGKFTYSELMGLIGLSDKPIRQAVRELQEQGWLQISQQNKFSPIHFTLHNPAAALREGDVILARLRLDESSFKGEALMREYLTLIVDSDEFEDNATPGFLVNPGTNEEMQLDRYYPPRVAFEFNGAQHYGPTALYAKEADIRKQQVRDLIKIGICTRRCITLVVVHPEDLTLEAIRQKVSDLLPLRNLDGHEPLVTFLADVSRAYRRQAKPSKNKGPN